MLLNVPEFFLCYEFNNFTPALCQDLYGAS